MSKRRDIEQAAEEIEQLFTDLWQVFPYSRGGRRGYRPQVDCYRIDDPPSVIAVMELPGIEAEDVQVVASQRALVIAGERRRPDHCGRYEQMEIDYGPFQRQLTFALDVDPEGAVATYERGILTITLPIAPKPAPRESVLIHVGTAP